MKKLSMQDILAQTIKELLEDHSPDQITVRDILEASGISRPTFYKYFIDKQDLIGYVFRKELCEPFFLDYSKALVDREVPFLKYLRKHQNFYLHALELTGQNSFYEMWLSLATDSLVGFYKSNPDYSNVDEKKIHFAAKYLAYAWVNMNICWLRNPDGLSAEEMAHQLNSIKDNSIKDFFNDK